MPTVARIGGFRIYFYSHEGTEPPHVHIDRGGSTAKVWLQNISLANQMGFSARELGNVLRLVRKHQQEFLEAWFGFFSGHDG